MSGAGKAKRQARAAATETESLREQLEQQRQELQRQKTRETEKAQRLLFRALRSGGGGFFATDPQTLGGNGGTLG